MEAMAADAPSSPAPAAVKTLPAPPYHHPADAVTPPPKVRSRSPLPSPLQVPSGGSSLQELLLLSSPPPPPSSRSRHRSRTRGGGLDDGLETPTPPRRRRRGAAEQCAAPAALASPRNGRRARRRLEREVEAEEDAASRKARRRKSARVVAPKVAQVVEKAAAAAAEKGEKGEDTSLALVPARARPDATGTELSGFVEHSGWEGLWERIVELVMWRNVAKSTLWFGCGSMFFFSCSCSREITFSPISALCHLGIMILGLAFFKDSVPQRPQVERGRGFQLTEDDLVRASRAVLPVANSMISTAQVIFSGEPLMTLKVLPVLLFGAKYGSLVTVWRLLAAGFFTSFTVPKLYSCYSAQIHNRVEILRDRILEAWKSCPRKKLVAATAVTMCWNMFSVKTRVMAAFISLVVLRYNQKYRKCDINMEVDGCQEGQEQNMDMDD